MSSTMQIGEVAKRSGLSLRTLRHYDEIGLLRPSGRSDGGFRLYTDEDLERLMVIRRMKPLGYSLEQMTDLLRAIDAGTSHDARQALADFHQDAVERRERLARQLDMADEFLSTLEQRLPRA